MYNNNTRHPEKWNIYPVTSPTQGFEQDETPELLSMFTAQIHGVDVMHHIFSVVRKNDKAILKNINYQIDRNQKKDSTEIIAEYPVEDIKYLIEECKEMYIEFAKKMVTDTAHGLGLNMNNPLYIIIKPDSATIEDMKEKMTEFDQRENINIGETILNIIEDLKPKKIVKKEEKSIEQKKTEEKELIRKYGRKKIEALAKEMNYKGVLVNNQNNNQPIKSIYGSKN